MEAGPGLGIVGHIRELELFKVHEKGQEEAEKVEVWEKLDNFKTTKL